jgi:hypothetical protein
MKVRWAVGGGPLVDYIVVVKRYLLVRPVRNEQAPLRLAWVRVYAPKPKQGGMWHARADNIDEEDYLVEVASLDCKVSCAFPDGPMNGNMWFMPYRTLSGVAS